MKRFLAIILLIFVFISPVFSKEFETTVSTVAVNNTDFYDIELLLSKNGKIFIPFKQVSELFDIKPVTNHSTHDITFEYKNKKGKITTNGIIFDGKNISKNHNFYLKKGLMNDVKDEIFCSPEDLEKIFNTKIEADEKNLSINVYLENINPPPDTKGSKPKEEFKIKAFQNVYAPNKNKKFELNSIGLNNNTLSDSISQYMMGQSQKNLFFNNNTQVLLGGTAYNGDYTININTYNYKGEFFSFGGLGFNYKNKFKNFEYEIGNPKGIIEKNYNIGEQLIGTQIRNYNSKKENYRDIKGYVDKTSLVKVFFDDEEITTLSTYDGYYSLDEIFTNKEPKKIKIVELKSDGTEETIFEKFLKNPEDLKKGEKHSDIILGTSGYNNRLFTQNSYIYELNTKKLVGGVQYQYGIADNIKLDTKLFADRIYYRPENSIWQSFYSPDTLLTAGTWKNPNNLDGVTNLNTVYFKKNDSLSYKLSAGVSSARDLSLGENGLFGYAVSVGGKLKRKFGNIEAELFNTSPDFYFAGSNGSFINDRLGGGISFDCSKHGVNLFGQYKKYFSNVNNKFDGGVIDFNDYNFGINKNFEKFANVRFNLTGRDGQNTFAKNNSYYYDFNISKQLTSNFYIEAGKSESNYQTNYKEGNGKFDKEDRKVANVPFKCNWLNDNVYTNKRGHVSPSGIDSGVYKVKIDNDKLAATLIDYENKTKMVRVEGGKTTRVEFPLKSCVGNISGKVNVVDDFDRKMDTKDFVVVLLDDKGEEKSYSTLDNNGEFYLSGVEPGVYFVRLDKNIIEENGLQNVENKSIIKVEIPYEYKNFADIKDINLVYSVVSI